MLPTPVFTQTPKCSGVQISTANTARDGSGTLGTVLTAGADGAKVERIRVMGVGTNTADIVRLFIDGMLFKEVPCAATTASATGSGFETDIDCTAPGSTLVLTAASVLKAGTHGGQTYNVWAIYGDY
jgi:hypothetical protein